MADMRCRDKFGRQGTYWIELSTNFWEVLILLSLLLPLRLMRGRETVAGQGILTELRHETVVAQRFRGEMSPPIDQKAVAGPFTANPAKPPLTAAETICGMEGQE